MQSKLILILFFAFIISSCLNDNDQKNKPREQQNRIIKYFKNGKIKYEGLIISGKKEGTHIWYFKNGKVDTESQFSNNMKHGRSVSYYMNGRLKGEWNYENNRQVGKAFTYYFNGKLKTKSIWIDSFISETGWKNTWYAYDSINSLLDFENSHFFKVENTKEFYTQNEPWKVEVNIIAPYKDYNISTLFGDFDSQFKSLDKSKEKRIIYKGKFKFNVNIDTKKKGENTLRFIIDNYKGDWSTMNLILKPTFFEYRYTVK